MKVCTVWPAPYGVASSVGEIATVSRMRHRPHCSRAIHGTMKLELNKLKVILLSAYQIWPGLDLWGAWVTMETHDYSIVAA